MRNRFFLIFIQIILTGIFTQSALAQNFNLTSPDGNLKVEITLTNSINWSVFYLDKPVFIQKAAYLDTEQDKTVQKNTFKKQLNREQNSLIMPEIAYKNAVIQDHYKELELQFKKGISIVLRAYNDGFAYRFEESGKTEMLINNENFNIEFPEETVAWYPEEESMYSHNERSYLKGSVDKIREGSFCSLPVKFRTKDGIRVLVTETGLHDYPNLFLQKQDKNGFTGIFPKYVLEAIPDIKNAADRNELITKEASFIAKKKLPGTFPWRLFIIGTEDGDLIESNLSYQLAEPCVLQNTSWIKPGKVAWDWYNANNIYGVDFKSGLNTSTYKYYIDFAADNGIEYVILDEGWTKSTTDILNFNPEMNVTELIRYGKEKGVGIILWVLWKPLNEHLDQILTTYKSWGAKGVKVDFMQRSDQSMVSSYEAIAKKAAELELLVDFHGCFKPSGLQRKYPNVLNYESVRGNENNKWSSLITPGHNLTIPFIRMAAGPMDYTPGAMVNGGKSGFAIHFERPMSQGTRCHQIAMYVLYEAPLQMLCESPSTYKKEQECLDFIAKIPTTWDETKVIKASIGEYLVIARRKGNNWYIGGMNDWTQREFVIPLDFLEGKFEANIITDGVNADRYPQDYRIIKKPVAKGDVLTIPVMPGGGFAAILING
ncbi:MAG TPA: glycoside hydrolase family 97 protein [Saprospiraceae bacterium]|nr:glycoside hydrolase family 97 protein [Saprospiraceae bacterium]